ncbi:hypothetical protein NW754_003103 [Fusarium falciforme]|nr:hypothetical protein NW754_003103 [Fusarium falciforme]
MCTEPEETRQGITILAADCLQDPEVVAVKDNDFAIDVESTSLSTASVSSSIFEYRKIHCRTYQSSNTTHYW